MLHSWPQRLAILLCLCGALFAQLHPGDASRVQLSQEARAGSHELWLDVPFIRQEKDGCGAAVIAMVMQYWRKQLSLPLDTVSDAAAIQRDLYSSKGHGIYASDVERYFKQHNFHTFVFPGEWDDLPRQIEKGRPLIVALKPALLERQLHYVVVVGVDARQEMVLVNDPAERKLLKKDRARFEREWNAAGRWTLLALPQERATH